MKNKIRLYIYRLFLFGFICLGMSTNAQAQVFAIDSISLVKTIKQWFTQIQQSQTVINAMNTVQKTSAAIGTAKATVQEFVTENKKKLEEAIKKVEDYKQRAEDYYAEYQKFKEAAEGYVGQGGDGINPDEFATLFTRQDNMAFAMALALPDGGTDVNGTFIIPKILAMACDNMSANDAIEKDVLDECLVKYNEERQKPQVNNKYAAPKVYMETMGGYAAAVVADAFKLINDADSFEEKFVEPVLYGPDANKTDTYVNIVEMAKGIDLQINSLLKMYSSQLALKNISDYYEFVFRNFSEEELKQVKLSSTIGKDDGTASDGTFIIAKMMAMVCGLDSETAKDVEKINECKNTLANLKEEEGFYIVRDEILHQLNKHQLETALKTKSEAGDYEDIQTDVLAAKFGGAEGSPAAPEGEDGTDIRKIQSQLIKISAQTAKNSIRIIEIMSNAIKLDEMHNFYLYDIANRKTNAG